MKCSQKYKAMMPKGDNDIVHTYLIQIQIATNVNAAPNAAQLYPLSFKHHDFLKWEIKNLLDDRII